MRPATDAPPHMKVWQVRLFTGTEESLFAMVDIPETYHTRGEDGATCYQVDYVSFAESVREENGEISPWFVWRLNLDVKRWEGSPTGSGTCAKSDPSMAQRLCAAEDYEKWGNALVVGVC